MQVNESLNNEYVSCVCVSRTISTFSTFVKYAYIMTLTFDLLLQNVYQSWHSDFVW